MRHLQKHRQIMAKLGWEAWEKGITSLYIQGFSGPEIREYIQQNSGYSIATRSIQRTLAKFGKTRTTGEAFRLAISRGRVHWKYKQFKFKRKRLNTRLRFEILKRDNFRCVLCGATGAGTLLEIDHKTPICRGGLSVPDNLQTLCYECNKGKQITEKER